MTKKFKIEDIVEVIGAVPGAAIQVGCWHKVHAVTGDGYVLLEGIEGVWHPTQFELQRRTRADVDYQVGDKVRILSDMYGEEWLGKEGVVTEVIPGDTWPVLVQPSNASSPAGYLEEELELISRYEPEIKNGTYWVTEVGHKSSPWTVTVKDERAVWEAADGGTPMVGYAHLLEIKSGKHAEKFPGIKFHTEDPTPKGFDALDKTKTYFLAVKNMPSSGWYLEYDGGQWLYGKKNDIRTEAASYEAWFTEGEYTWEKPVEYVAPPLTDLEKFEQAGYIGPRYHLVDSGLNYKVTAKGNVKNRFSDRSLYTDGWDNMNNSFEWFDSRVKSGDLIEI